jgi:hypothetical protein
METRIYEANQEGKNPRLVDASSPSQALRHVAKAVIEITIPNTKRVAELLKAGVEVETVSAPKTDPTDAMPF